MIKQENKFEFEKHQDVYTKTNWRYYILDCFVGIDNKNYYFVENNDSETGDEEDITDERLIMKESELFEFMQD